MDNSITFTGLILTSKNVGDYDKWVTILTKERGRIGAFVRGARRPKSQVLPAGSAMVYGTFTAYEGRDSISITGCDISEHFTSIKNNIDLIWYATYFMEVADYFARDGMDERERLRLLYRSILALSEESFSKEHVKMVYELKTMVINGDAPNVFECMCCGKRDGENGEEGAPVHLSHFSMNHRGAICDECAREAGGEEISQSVLHAMQHISAAPVEKLFTFVLKDPAFSELLSIIIRYRHRYMEHSFNSERFLDN